MKKEHSERWITTERRLEQVTLELMKRSDLEHITVRAICERAKVNRSTFYEHFADVYDLFDKMESEMRRGIIERYEVDNADAFSVSSFIPLFTHIKENEFFYKIVLKTRNSFPIRQGFERLLNDVLRPMCEKEALRMRKKSCIILYFFKLDLPCV